MKAGLFVVFGTMLIMLFAAGCTSSGNNAQPAPASASQLKAWIEPRCPSMSGAELNNCTYNQALQSKDVAVCTTLDNLEARNTCITSWCLSGARDYNTCYRIADKNDQLLCLSKCNPNQIK